MKRVGPELKMPDLRSLKVPTVLEDLYQDLRDRRLLPLVALILVAIVAVPFVLGGGGAEEEEPVSPVIPLEAGASSASASLAVVPATPGLRDYRKRLRHRSATDPFKPQYTGPVLAGTQLGGSPETSMTTTATESSGSSSSSSPEAPSSSGSTGGSPSVPPGKGKGDEGGATGDGDLSFYTVAIDVKITKTSTLPDGRKSKPEVVEKERVLPPAQLPSAKTEVLTYIGVSPKTGEALFLVSEDVGSVFGDVKCVAGSGRCQLLELEKGFPVTFLYGDNDVRYKVNLLDMETVSMGRDANRGESTKP
jgi:hypothetical protein